MGVSNQLKVVLSALSESLSLLGEFVAFSELPSLLAAFLDEDLLTLLELNVSDAVLAKEDISLTWASSVSATVLGDILAKLIIASLDWDSSPLLGLLAVAWPEVETNVVLVLVVGSGEASLGLGVLDSVAVDINLLGSVLGVVLSHNKWGTWLDVLAGKVADSKMWLSVESDGSRFLVHNEPGSPVVLLSELEHEVLAVLLLGEVDVSSTGGFSLDLESVLVEINLGLLLGLLFLSEILGSLAWSAVPPLEGSHILDVSLDLEASLSLIGDPVRGNSDNLILGDLSVHNSSEDSFMAWLESLVHSVSECEVSLALESNGHGSLVIEEEGVSWMGVLLDLSNSIDADFLLGHEHLLSSLVLHDN